MLTLGVSSWSLHRHLPYFGGGSWSPPRAGEEIPVQAFPALAASYGIRQLEICQMHLASTEPAYLDAVRDAASRAGCAVVNVPIDVGNIAQAGSSRRAEDLAAIERWIDAAHFLGSPAVRVNAGHAVDGDDAAAALGRSAEGFRRLATYCAERGMTLLMENHWGLTISPANIMTLYEAVNAPNFKLCPDFGNFPPESREDGLRLMLPHAAMVHAKVLDLDADGRHSAFDLQRCLDMVRESGYAGTLSIEFEGEGDQREGIATAKRLIAEHLGSLVA
jgi:sugar phosphate isomerase/epimerase